MIKSIRIIISIAMISFFAQSVIAEVSTIEIPELIPKDMSIISTLENFITDRSEDYPEVKCYFLIIAHKTSYDIFYQYKKRQLRAEIKDAITNDSTIYIVTTCFASENEFNRKDDIGYINIGEYTFILRNVIGDKFTLENYFKISEKKQSFKIKENEKDPIILIDDRLWPFYFLDGKFYQLIPPKHF